MSRRALVLWFGYVLFAGFALYLNRGESPIDFGGRLGMVKLGVWASLGGFLAYSIYCSSRGDLFRSIGSVLSLHWGRHIGADLYFGLLLGLLVICLNEGDLVALLWIIPIVVFANLAVLLYFAIHFDSIVLKLPG